VLAFNALEGGFAAVTGALEVGGGVFVGCFSFFVRRLRLRLYLISPLLATSLKIFSHMGALSSQQGVMGQRQGHASRSIQNIVCGAALCDD
jgi:hypothetical protein